MPDSTGRRFTQQEFALVLRKAAELQEQHVIPTRREGFTLDEMEQIASEVGIPAEHLRRAVALMDLPQLTLGERLLGAPATFRVEHIIPGSVEETTLQRMVDAARLTAGKQGEVKFVLDALEWEDKDDFSGTHLNIARRGEQTRVQLIAHLDSGYVMLVVTPLLSVLAGGIAGAALGLDTPLEIGAAAAGALGAGTLGMRALWRRMTRTWRGRLETLLGLVIDTAKSADRQVH